MPSDIDTTPATQAAEYLIRKGGAYYRPNAAGYTNNVDEAGRYSLEDAVRHSHPNGPDGPRDGIDYMLAPARQAHSLPGDVGTVAEIKAHVDRYTVHDDARRIYSTAQLETAIRLALAALTPSAPEHIGDVNEMIASPSALAGDAGEKPCGVCGHGLTTQTGASLQAKASVAAEWMRRAAAAEIALIQAREAFQKIATGKIDGEPNNVKDTLSIIRQIATGALAALATEPVK